MKRFFRILKEKMTAYEIFIILISAIVGAIFSFVGNLNIKISIIVCLSIIAAFLLVTVLVQLLSDRFNILRLIKKFINNKHYNLAIMLGDDISHALWHAYKLKLRVDVAKQVIIAVRELKQSLTAADFEKVFGGKKYDLDYLIATKYIDDLGYTNFILDRFREGFNNIKKGIEIINDVLNHKTTEDRYYKFLELKLKALRHQLGMIKIIEEKYSIDLVNKIRKDFTDCLTELKDKTAIASDALTCAEYARIKDDFGITQEKGTSDIQKLIEQVDELKANLQTDEWKFKCERLKWELQLYASQNIKSNYEDLKSRIITGKDLTINRLLDIYKRFLSYAIYLVQNIDGSKEDAKNILKIYKSDVKEINKKVVTDLYGCEAKRSLKELGKIKKELAKVLYWKSFVIKHKLLIGQFNLFVIDFDHTIFDYYKAEKYALKKTINSLKNTKAKRRFKDIYRQYREIDANCWQESTGSVVTSDRLISTRTERCRKLAEYLELPAEREQDIIKGMKKNILRTYFMHGFKKFIKIANPVCIVMTDSNKDRPIKILKKIIPESRIFSSTDCGAFKSNSDYFSALLQKYSRYVTSNERILVIGDNMETDMQCAKYNNLYGCLLLSNEAHRKGEKANLLKCAENCDENKIYHVKDFGALLRLKHN